ncbi:vitamin K epoxide reductase family protein [Fontivita pretiosa]|uniref:vitamin K epoxide reductase family protein n=1 Tax=Fontivita pretiosa TaxID=2989684 RepID=UPI003D181A22
MNRLAESAPGRVPPGWSYNPSTWPQRGPIILAAVVGFVLAMYLSLYQWRIIAGVWDPLFASPLEQYRNGSERILNTWVSELFPVPDAFLGALGYLADAITGAIGGPRRWRTMPWMVIVFGVFVGPLGAVSVLLVILQPVLFDAWCAICLATAVISVVMIGPAMDEMLASLQFVVQEKRRGGSIWRAFWGRV